MCQISVQSDTRSRDVPKSKFQAVVYGEEHGRTGISCRVGYEYMCNFGELRTAQPTFFPPPSLRVTRNLACQILVQRRRDRARIVPAKVDVTQRYDGSTFHRSQGSESKFWRRFQIVRSC